MNAKINGKKIRKQVIRALGAMNKPFAAVSGFLDRQAADRATPFMSRLVDAAANNFAKANGDDIHGSDHLIVGRRDKFAEHAFGVRYNADGTINHKESVFPWLGRKVPDSLRQPILWDGRTPDGERKAWLSYADVTKDDEIALLNGSAKNGLRFASILTATTFLVSIFHNATLPTLPAHAWGDWVSSLPPMEQLHVYASGSVVWTLDVVGKLIELLMTNAWPVAACATLTAVVFSGAMLSGVAIGFLRSLQSYKRQLLENWTMQSQDSELLYGTNTIKRLGVMKVYANAVEQALGWRKHMPLLSLGTAIGLMRWKGMATAPVRGQMVCLDGISLRQNTLILGGVGTGKTRDGLIPLAEGYFNADFSEKDADGNVIREHKAGALIADGKGKLASDMMKIIPAHRLIDVRLIGTEDGWFVMDVTEGMSVNDIVELYILLAKQKAGSVENEQWINGSGNAFGAAGHLGRLLETITVIIEGKNIWANRGCTPSSLMGMYKIATDFELNQKLSKFVIDEADKGTQFDQSVIDAANHFSGYWKELAVETRSSFVSNIENTLGDLTQNKRLADRFASGKNKSFPTARIEELFEGKILLLAFSEIVDGIAGKTIANFIKQRAYLMAQRRLAESSKAEELLSRVKDCKENYDVLLARSNDLNQLEVAMQAIQFGEENANPDALAKDFTKFFPDEEFVGIHRARRVMQRELDGIESKLASYTDDVMLMALPGQDQVEESDLMTARYLEIRDYPKTSTVMVMIDEYQDYVTVGDGGKADSTFLNKDRETGMFLAVATQTIHSLSKKIGHTEMMDMMPIFTNKIVFRVDDVETHKYLIETAGTAFQSNPYSRNLYSNAYQQMNAIINNRRVISATTRHRSLIWPSLKTDIDVNAPFEFSLQKIDVGGKNALSDEEWKTATRNVDGNRIGFLERRTQKIQEEEAIKQEMKDGSEQPLLTVNDLKTLEEGHAFVFWNQAGMSRQDFVYMRPDGI